MPMLLPVPEHLHKTVSSQMMLHSETLMECLLTRILPSLHCFLSYCGRLVSALHSMHLLPLPLNPASGSFLLSIRLFLLHLPVQLRLPDIFLFQQIHHVNLQVYQTLVNIVRCTHIRLLFLCSHNLHSTDHHCLRLAATSKTILSVLLPVCSNPVLTSLLFRSI